MNTGVGDALRVFAHTIDSILESRFAAIEIGLSSLERRLVVLETVPPTTPKPATTLIVPAGAPGPIISAAPPPPVTHAQVPQIVEGEHSWYALTIDHPVGDPDISPNHLIAVMYKVNDSKAIDVKQYAASLKLNDSGKPVLNMVLYVNRSSIQSHFIQRWNMNEKGTVQCRKLKRTDIVMDAFRNLRVGQDSLALSAYRTAYAGAFVGARWGSITPEFITTHGA